MKTGEARHIVSDEQQADFGRYLNELNCVSEMPLLAITNLSFFSGSKPS